MSYTVYLSSEALDRLDTIEQYISDAGSPVTAARYVDAIVNFCQSLATFPQRGTMRDDLMPGLRITNYRKNAVIAFFVDVDAETVSIIDVFYGGQNYEAEFDLDTND
jgi:toxin ParE1/3/4